MRAIRFLKYNIRGGFLGNPATFWCVAGALNLVMIGANLQTPLYSTYQHRFGFSEVTVTLIYATYTAGTLLALLVLGRLSDQIGRRVTALPALGLMAVSTVLFIFTTNVAMLFIARAISGFAVGLISGTTTAWLVDLAGQDHLSWASFVASTDNLLGLGLGPLFAGLLAQYLPMPTKLVYFCYLAIIAGGLLLLWMAAETVERADGPISLAPRLGVPKELRGQFISPAATIFAVFALAGLFSGLIPSILSKHLHDKNHALAGAVVLAFDGSGVLASILFYWLKSNWTTLLGAALMPPALALVVLALPEKSLAILLCGTILGGMALGLGFRGSLQVVNQMAPGKQRAEVVSTYFVVAYIAIALPVIGVGVLSKLAGAFAANVTFAIVIAGLAIMAVVAGCVFPPKIDQNAS